MVSPLEMMIISGVISACHGFRTGPDTMTGIRGAESAKRAPNIDIGDIRGLDRSTARPHRALRMGTFREAPGLDLLPDEERRRDEMLPSSKSLRHADRRPAHSVRSHRGVVQELQKLLVERRLVAHVRGMASAGDDHLAALRHGI